MKRSDWWIEKIVTLITNPIIPFREVQEDVTYEQYQG